MYQQVVDYGANAANTKWWKIIAMGIMGGIFIALGYLGYLAIKGSGGDKTLMLVMASAIFPAGILMCVFMGGSLFTSDSLSFLAMVEGKAKWYHVIKGLGCVLLGNAIGGLVVAGIATGAGFFSPTYDAAGHLSGNAGALEHLVEAKQSIKIYNGFFSGIFCNMLVAGGIVLGMSVQSSGAKAFLIWMPVTLFVIGGFQHVVANFFIFFAGLFNPESNLIVGDFILRDLFMAMLGNWFAGAIMIPMPYYFINKFSHNKELEKAVVANNEIESH